MYALMNLEISVSKILAHGTIQNCQSFIVMTSNMIYIVALGSGFKCPHKIHLNTQCPLPPLFLSPGT